MSKIETNNPWVMDLNKLPVGCPIGTARKEGQTYAFCGEYTKDGESCEDCLSTCKKKA